jgi:cytoskeleton protein RodZ
LIFLCDRGIPMGQERREQTGEAMARVIPLSPDPELGFPGGLGDGDEPSLGWPQDVARALRSARRRRRVTLEQVAEETRLPRKALAAFEGAGDPADLPEPPYNRYFLREYARYLGMSEKPLLGALADRSAEEPAIMPELIAAETPPRRWPVRTLVAGSAAVLVILGMARFLPGSSAPLERSGTVAPPPVQATRSQPPLKSPRPSGPHGVGAALNLSGPCWIEAIVDGRVVLRETVAAGRTVRLHAKRTLELTLGNAGAVTLRVNGERINTGATGQVVRLSFRWSHGRLREG